MRNPLHLDASKNIKIISGAYKAAAFFEKEVNDSLSQGWRIIEIIQVNNGNGESYAQVFLVKPTNSNNLAV